ncbi:protein KRI1 homolog [Salvia hispanica]|uniref:protein KRI1 homolog n=1 Tax=Salvia hispanica TaxID=49212 RepID=UPI0020095FD2|nr:protein KRI1 homolog [Salvia hispanica]
MDRLQLFAGDGDSSDEDISKIEIDQEFAKRYEHNKKREELHRYEALKKQGKVESSDSEESSSEEEFTKPSKKTDAKFFDALIKVKNQDPILREPDAKLFDSDSDDSDQDEDSSNKKKEKKGKPMYLKDVVSKQLIEAGPELSDEEEENGDDDDKVKSYSQEQEERRKQIVQSLDEGETDGDDDDGDFLRVKSSGKDEEDEEEDDVLGEKMDKYFGEDTKLDEEMMFLKEYFWKRLYDEESNARGDVEVDISEDEDEVEKQEDYEREFNFRFEENAGDRVMGHSRRVEGSVRKKDNARKSQRERKEERMAQAEFERKEELKRLKNLKKKEINEKLEKIREVAGIGKAEGVFLDKDDLEDEFDPVAHDRKMKEAFGEEYYGAEDVDPQFGSDGDEDEEGLEKPDFDKEDELLGLDKGWDEVDEAGAGFKSVRERIMKDRLAKGEEDVVDEDGGDERKERGSKRKRKHKPSEVEKAVIEELLDEYYKLDYEDTIGDLKTRFKYRPVKAKRFGLTSEEILALDDKELNQYVSLKKIAPYREKEWKVPRIKTIQLKESKYRKGSSSRVVDEDRKGRHHEGKGKEVEDKAVGSEKSQPVESNGDEATISRKRKRKQQQAELKISQSRLMAYGKIPSKSKSKN